ncbi:MAG: glycosyltransferase [Chitinophagales bacterium]|nr:glycosyltransferase [Chitinophagales bacterium]
MTTILAITYSYLMLWIFRGWKKTLLDQFLDSENPLAVSIIIPVRNEVEHITSCIESILNNDYPASLFEIIIIDDHSTDETRKKVQSIDDSRVCYVPLPDHLSGKKRAIACGIDQARFPIILCTDGDSLLDKNWIKHHAEQYNNPKIKICTGVVLPENKNTLLAQFQWLDFASMMAVTANGINRKKYYLGNGASLSYRKSAFIENQGFEGNWDRASGDDIFLIQKIAQTHSQSVAFVGSTSAIAHTKSEKTWKAFLNQRKRWASKALQSFDQQVKVIQGFIFVYMLILMLLIPLTLFAPTTFLTSLLLLLFVKLLVDFWLLRRLSHHYKNSQAIYWFLPAFILYIFHIFLSGIYALFPPSFEWKGRQTS